MAKRHTYRNKLADGTKLVGKTAVCAHCDGFHSCEYEQCKAGCTCDCHFQLRKETCYCIAGTLKCCKCCGCKCHVSEWKEYCKADAKREKEERAREKAAEKARFAAEGVQEWEKEAYNFLRQAHTMFALEHFFRIWCKTHRRHTKETGAAFAARVMKTPWGKNNFLRTANATK